MRGEVEIAWPPSFAVVVVVVVVVVVAAAADVVVDVVGSGTAPTYRS